MTSLDDEELAVKIVQGGAQDYIVKTKLNKESLIRSIRYAIERSKLSEKIMKHSLMAEAA